MAAAVAAGNCAVAGRRLTPLSVSSRNLCHAAALNFIRPAAVYGSIRPELTAFGLASEDSPIDEDLTILTDSLSCMNLLKSTRRKKKFTLAVLSRGATASGTCGQPD